MHEQVSTEDSRKGARLPQGPTLKQRSLKLPSVTHVSRVEKRKGGRKLNTVEHPPPIRLVYYAPAPRSALLLSVQTRKAKPKEVTCCQGHHGHLAPGWNPQPLTVEHHTVFPESMWK